MTGLEITALSIITVNIVAFGFLMKCTSDKVEAEEKLNAREKELEMARIKYYEFTRTYHDYNSELKFMIDSIKIKNDRKK